MGTGGPSKGDGKKTYQSLRPGGLDHASSANLQRPAEESRCLGLARGGTQDVQPGFVLAGVIFGWRGTVSGNFVHETSKRELAISGEWRRPKRIEGIELSRRSPAKNVFASGHTT